MEFRNLLDYDDKAFKNLYGDWNYTCSHSQNARFIADRVWSVHLKYGNYNLLHKQIEYLTSKKNELIIRNRVAKKIGKYKKVLDKKSNL